MDNKKILAKQGDRYGRLVIIESRISEIIGDAQPKPALRAELEELIKRIKQ